MPAWRKHERVNDHLGRTLLDAASEAFGDRWLCNLHVRRLHDASRTKTLLDQGSDFIEQRVGRSPSTPVVDQEYRGALIRRLFVCAGETHRAYLGHSLHGVKNYGPRAALKRSRTARA